MIRRYVLLVVLGSSCLLTAQTSVSEIEQQLDTLVNRTGFRTYSDTATLNAVGVYIENEFKKYTKNTYRQEYTVQGRQYFNVIGLLGDTTKPRVIIGAHYDVCHEQQGADDNGTGIVGLIQAIKQLSSFSSDDYCYEFVAYTLEEPPFFRTEAMGSFVHAKSLKDREIDVHGMIALEMIGYFSDEKKSQSYPARFLRLFYGSVGDYITLVRRMNKGPFARTFSRKYKHSKSIKTKKFTGPRSLQGIDFSDHLNYWDLGYDAIMLTDTAFFRNKNYHQESDTLDTIDFERMAGVIDALVMTLKNQ
ncbi:MAG: Zn-dependent M28 family amino/carboxypeptidase [Crocinitomicaceae bacterium]|jgi:Zn-dependent M28 family amino/carboxypeptidase